MKRREKIVAESVPHLATLYDEFFYWGSRHHCLMEVDAYGHRRTENAKMVMIVMTTMTIFPFSRRRPI